MVAVWGVLLYRLALVGLGVCLAAQLKVNSVAFPLSPERASGRELVSDHAEQVIDLVPGGVSYDGSDRPPGSGADRAFQIEMIEPEPTDHSDAPIWCLIDIAEIAGVIEAYEPWKDGPWYHDLDWVTVATVLDRLLRHHAEDGEVADIYGLVDPVAKRLRRADAEGLFALVVEPITATHVQITNGGHRLRAMLRQGVASVPGLFSWYDVPGSVPPHRVYPLRCPPTVG